MVRDQKRETVHWPRVLLLTLLLAVTLLVVLGLWFHITGPQTQRSPSFPVPEAQAEPPETVAPPDAAADPAAGAGPAVDTDQEESRNLRKVGPWTVRQVANPRLFNRDPMIGEDGTVVWWATRTQGQGSDSEIFMSRAGKTICITCPLSDARFHRNPITQYAHVWWTGEPLEPVGLSEYTYQLLTPPDAEAYAESIRAGAWQADGSDAPPFGTNAELDVAESSLGNFHQRELYVYKPGVGPIRLTADDRNDAHPAPLQGGGLAWQKSQGFPLGWEIMVHDGTRRFQATLDLYEDLAPVAHGRTVVWYGWDGQDYEIFFYDGSLLQQLTRNTYDDEAPQFDGLQIVWQGYSGMEPDIFRWRRGEGIRQLSANPLADENVVTWNGTAVWQSFDGTDHEIAIFADGSAESLTQNQYDDLEPAFRDGVLAWTAYVDNWDAEIMAWDGTETFQLTDNDIEDIQPQTAGGRVVWQAEDAGGSYIFVAERDDL